MNNIKLDITKAACFLEAGAVKAFEPKVKDAQKALEEGTCWGGCTCPQRLLPHSSMRLWLRRKYCATTARQW